LNERHVLSDGINGALDIDRPWRRPQTSFVHLFREAPHINISRAAYKVVAVTTCCNAQVGAGLPALNVSAKNRLAPTQSVELD
jgi:hypothetical protein